MSYDDSAPDIDIGDLNEMFLFQEVKMEQTIRRYMQSYEAPFWAARAIPEFDYKLGEGYIKDVWTAHGAPAPQQHRDTLWTPVRKSGLDGGYKPQSNHSGADDCPPGTYDGDHNSCRPDPKARINWGFERMSYIPYQSWLDTDSFCLKDLQHDWEVEQVIAHILRNLRDAISGHAENWNRDTYFAHCKIFPSIENFFAHEQDELGLFPDIGLNPKMLTQRPLDELYELLVGEYADKAISMDGNQPVFGLITGERESNAIKHQEPEWRQDMRYLQDPALTRKFSNPPVFRNFAHMWDAHAPRFVLDGSQPSGVRRVYRWKEVATTKGVKRITDPEFLRAPYTASAIYMNDVFSNGKLSYKDKVGEMGGEGVTMLREAELHWVNFKERGNELGQIGKYLVEFTRAPRPGVKPGFAFLHARAGFETPFRSSQTSCPVTIDPCGTVLTSNVTAGVQDSATQITLTLTAAISGLAINEYVNVYFSDGYWLKAQVNTIPSGTTLKLTFKSIADPVEVAIADHLSVHAVVAL